MAAVSGSHCRLAMPTCRPLYSLPAPLAGRLFSAKQNRRHARHVVRHGLRASPMPENVDVAIIGGGPCGLACAHALHQALPPGTRIAVFEKAPAATIPRGAGLGLAVNGLKAIRAICPAAFEEVYNNSSRIWRIETRAPNGSVVKVTELEASMKAARERHGINSVQLGWHELVAILFKHLPAEVQVVHSVGFQSYEEVQGGGYRLVLRANDAEAEEHRRMVEVKAGMVVAADGYFSRVREQCVADGPPHFGGTMVWRARLTSDQVKLFGFEEGKSVWYFGNSRVILVYTAGPGHIVWTASCPETALEEAGIDWKAVAEAKREVSAQAADYVNLSEIQGRQAKERLLRAYDGFEPAILDLIASTDPGAVVEHAIYVRPAAEIRPESFGKGRVVIVGDAAHPQRPTGQGTSQALEDAMSLARFIQRDNGGFHLLDEWRRFRAARVQPIVMQAEVQAKAAYKKDPKEGARESTRGIGMKADGGQAGERGGVAVAEGADEGGARDTLPRYPGLDYKDYAGLVLPVVSPEGLLLNDEAFLYEGEDWSPLVPAVPAEAGLVVAHG